MSGGQGYRADIDGLRAVAVLGVLIYHAKLGLLSGGYTGVDVFFVISGFLISSILAGEIEDGRFSNLRFYERRIRRIFPALFAMLFATLAAGYVLLAPSDYLDLGYSAFAAAAFFSNYHYLRHAGYFAPAAEMQPLLHTWSLGVEEQFYLIAPIALWALLTRARRHVKGIVAGAFVASLAASVYGVAYQLPWAFYLLPSRAFELLMGVMLALGFLPGPQTRRARVLGGMAGLAAIAAAMLLLSNVTPFPGLAALLPCTGAALVIWAGGSGTTPADRLLRSAPAVLIGKISYSLYLWHWPLLAFGAYAAPDSMTAPVRAGLLLAAAAISFASWAWIETPARRGKVNRTLVFLPAAAVIMLCYGISRQIDVSNGAIARFPQAAQVRINALQRVIDETNVCALRGPADLPRASTCTIGAKGGTPSFLLFGDSHALALSAEISRLAGSKGMTGLFVLEEGCPPVLGLEAYSGWTFRKCIEASKALTPLLEDSQIKTLIVVARWAMWTEGTRTTNEWKTPVRQLVPGNRDANREAFARALAKSLPVWRSHGRRVVVFGPTPELDFNLSEAITRNVLANRPLPTGIPAAGFKARQAFVLPMLQAHAHEEGVTLLYPHELLCDAARCNAFQGEKPLYVDDDHLNTNGSRLLDGLIGKALDGAG